MLMAGLLMAGLLIAGLPRSSMSVAAVARSAAAAAPRPSALPLPRGLACSSASAADAGAGEAQSKGDAGGVEEEGESDMAVEALRGAGKGVEAAGGLAGYLQACMPQHGGGRMDVNIDGCNNSTGPVNAMAQDAASQLGLESSKRVHNNTIGNGCPT